MKDGDTTPKSLAGVHLPDDWWQYESVCQGLAEWFSRHLLGLLVEIESHGDTHCGVFSGFLLDHLEYLWWVTAGHVIERICDLRSNPQVRVRRMRWLDGCEIPGAESVPVDDRDLKMFSALEDGIDFGMALIPSLDAVSIVRNDQVLVMTEQAWRNIHLAQPEGYYVMGYPEEWVEVSKAPLSGNQILYSLRAGRACLPVRRIQYRGLHPTKEFWSDPDAFYGEILPFADVKGHQPSSMAGLSGGPLLSIERTPDGELLYRLFGVQRSQDRAERLIRAEPIGRLVNLMTK